MMCKSCEWYYMIAPITVVDVTHSISSIVLLNPQLILGPNVMCCCLPKARVTVTNHTTRYTQHVMLSVKP